MILKEDGLAPLACDGLTTLVAGLGPRTPGVDGALWVARYGLYPELYNSNSGGVAERLRLNEVGSRRGLIEKGLQIMGLDLVVIE